MTEAVGWLSSILLLTTIGTQIVKQWRARSAEGVSRWLFVGQAASSLGFLVYSALLHNWVFTLTNGMLLLSALVGATMTFHFKRKAGSTGGGPPPQNRDNRSEMSLNSDPAAVVQDIGV